ncbi:MAG: translation initiation factor IF-2 [Porphyromonas sp.]|uniref:translation initiation factor IF-2 n=1 Tax=Porphyromonas sp. TaxID=1924944 RepID=UPI002A91F015|nr:translation initiation factor IF-2 [Porphyromonas sp.]MDD7468699.1 translation initiation factor IF-2 [Bacteroidales bacterium]MDY6101458.1 translation initiation factor IF-2 [Porphyromonas sp.]
MPAIKLNKVARDLNVGVSTLSTFLSKKNPNGDYKSPNTKLTTAELKTVLEEYGSDLSADDKKRLTESYLSKSPKGTTSTEEVKQTEPKAAKPEPTSEAAPAAKSKPSFVKGHLQLDDKGRVIPVSAKSEKPEEKPAPEVKTPKPAKPAEEPKKPAAPKVEKPKVEQPKIEQPKPEAPKAKEKPVVEKKPQPDKDTQKPSEPKKEQEKPATDNDETKEEEDGVFRIGTTDDMGLTVVGKIDLSKIEPKTSRRKRKRIKGNKVDIDKQAKQDSGKGAGRDSNNRRNKDNRAGNNNSGNNRNNKSAAANPKKGRKSRRREEQQEITQEDIQKQIKKTMAAMQGRGHRPGKTAAQYRREKREARQEEAEELMRAQEGESKKLKLTEFVTVNDLAKMLDIPVNDIIVYCFNLGLMVSINQRLEKDQIDLILDEYGYEAIYVDAQAMQAIETQEDKPEDLEPRAPVVTVMGHVDHGKTSLLDAVRKSDVISGEAGGITQHIGAYRVTLEGGRKLTFVDTPGHEAFTAMRARGAKVTDIVIIVIAADDGIMPQTKEAISHASLAGVPIVFAINKVDKPGAKPDMVREQLAAMNYLVEEWGGKYQCQEISAKKGIGVQDLLEKVLLEADLLELKANPNKLAKGSVLESTLEQGRGYTTKVLIQEGTLRNGDYIVAGANYGRVKALFDEYGETVEAVGPSMPVKVLGLNGATPAGETLNALETESDVRDIARQREQLQREQKERTQHLPSLETFSRQIKDGEVQELNIIVKGDMDGSVEALSDSLVKLSTEEIRVNVIYSAVGAISQSDVDLAAASDALIVGFQVRPAQGARRAAEDEGVEIRFYSIIYDAIEDVKSAMEGMLSPEIKEQVTATLEVRKAFRIPKVGTIAGCMVEHGKVSRDNKARVIRDGIVIHTGPLVSLKRFKDDVKEVTTGLECGLSIKDYDDIQAGDQIETFEEFAVKRKLE